MDENGDYAYREGYHKLLVDFKMFDADGNILPQGNITPNLNEGFMKDLLNAEVDKKQNYKFPQEVYDDINKKFGSKHSDRSTKTFKNGQNANGVFVANALIDLADSKSKWWTGRYNHDIFTMSKSDDTEFRQFYREILNRTKDMEDYGEESRIVNDSFTVKDHKGREYIYHVKLDGYLHGVALEKIDKATYEAALQRETKGGTNGKSLADIKRRTGTDRAKMGRYSAGDGRNRASDGNPGYGGLGSGSSQSHMAGTDGGENSSNRKVPAVTKKSERSNTPTFYSQMAKVVEGMKQEKFGASSVISMLRGRGVKAEEIRWSGIHAFLDGKKSVTKQELLVFINTVWCYHTAIK